MEKGEVRDPLHLCELQTMPMYVLKGLRNLSVVASYRLYISYIKSLSNMTLSIVYARITEKKDPETRQAPSHLCMT